MKKKIISSLVCLALIIAIFPIQAFASTNGFVSDTIKDFTIPKGNNYTLKITPDNKKVAISVTTGNNSVVRVIQTIKNNNSYYVTLTAAGEVSDCTGLYVQLNNKQTKLCNVTVSYRVNNTGKHIDQIIGKDGKVTEILNQDKGWQLQIEEKPIHFHGTDVNSFGYNDNITLRSSLSSVNSKDKYLIIEYSGALLGVNSWPNDQLKFTTASGKELNYASYNKLDCKFKVSYDNIDDIKTMYFGTDTEKVTLKMIYFK